MHTLDEILKHTREGLKLCTAVEDGGSICFNKVKSKKLCEKHYRRLRNTGTINLIPKKQKKCKFIDCDDKHRARGYCIKHYKQFIKSKIICNVDNCSTPISSKKLCKKHYTRMLKYGDVNGRANYKPYFHEPEKRRITPRLHFKCIAPKCEHTFETSRLRKGLCRNHYYKWSKYGDYK